MKFTDEDLKRLKESVSDDKAEKGNWYVYDSRLSYVGVKALIARLEAAEFCLQPAICQCPDQPAENEAYCAFAQDRLKWRKAAGK